MPSLYLKTLPQATNLAAREAAREADNRAEPSRAAKIHSYKYIPINADIKKDSNMTTHMQLKAEIESAMINNFKLTPEIAAEMQTYFMEKTEVTNLQEKLNSLQQTNPSIVVYKTPLKLFAETSTNAIALLSFRKARSVHGITNSYILIALESPKKERFG